MTVLIRFENVLSDDGYKLYKLSTVQNCMTSDALPSEYLQSPNHFYLQIEGCMSGTKKTRLTVKSEDPCPIGTYRHDIVIGSLVSGEMKQWIINTCKKGGEWLHHYNLERWEGKQVTYCF